MSTLCLALGAMAIAGCYSPTLPLPPPARAGLTVSSPDADGFVVVIGEPGVLAPDEQVVIINRDTLYGWIAPTDEDGGFEVIVIAEAGHFLAIQRRIGDEVGQPIEIIVPEE